MLDLALDNRLFIYSFLDEAIQEIDLLFSTECTELLGNVDYGITMEQFLWTLTPTTEECKKYLQDKLSKLEYLNKFNYQLHVDFLEGEFRSIYHVHITIYVDENQIINKEYEFR